MHIQWLPSVSYYELMLRGLVVYAFLVAALRMGGRRELAQMTSFDLILLLILSNAVQNSINAGDNSLVGGLVSAATLLAINRAVGWAVYLSPWFEKLMVGRPIRVVTDGKVHVGALRSERLTLPELRSALRKQGIEGISECKRVILEPDGTLTAVRKGQEPHSLAELTHPCPDRPEA
jgi:uncharacterized membrane protein YcaP (DUF421 family)